jgi:hypothetical protein
MQSNKTFNFFDVGEDWHASINKAKITGRESVFLKVILYVFKQHVQ